MITPQEASILSNRLLDWSEGMERGRTIKGGFEGIVIGEVFDAK